MACLACRVERPCVFSDTIGADQGTDFYGAREWQKDTVAGLLRVESRVDYGRGTDNHESYSHKPSTTLLESVTINYTLYEFMTRKLQERMKSLNLSSARQYRRLFSEN
jgi:hypothetical protein